MTVSSGRLTNATSGAAILARLIRPGRDDPSDASARSPLQIDFEEADRERMHGIAARNQGGTLGEAERAKGPPQASGATDASPGAPPVLPLPKGGLREPG
ncbi:MAG TPA: hypothetical protein VKP69_32390 [Isosphaeraceae bacterium]|nr:hypothetical protein [Isosphaeraceae bacterium]